MTVPPAPPVHLIVYTSTSLIPVAYAEREVAEIVGSSAERNWRNGVTGALFYSHEQRFAQAIEGSEIAVSAVMAKIRQDKRHSRIVMLHDGPADARRFAGWSLAYRGDVPAVDYVIRDAEAMTQHASGAALNRLLDMMVSLSPMPRAN